MKRFFLTGVVLILPFAGPKAAALEGSPRLAEAVLELREELRLSPLMGSTTLDRVAERVARANLDRPLKILHTDAQGKDLAARTLEEGYVGASGEIVAVRLIPCPVDPESESVQAELGKTFKKLVKDSPQHYRGLTVETRIHWRQFGQSHQISRKQVDGECVEKHSLAIVLGQPDPIRR